eukprot:scaffold100632_cov24-Cyclotella_meneghiniana.AAC.1
MKFRRKSTKSRICNLNATVQKEIQKPSQLEVVAKKTANQTAQFNDDISVITPVTGLPPEDHGHLNAMGMAPPPQ